MIHVDTLEGAVLGPIDALGPAVVADDKDIAPKA